MFGPSKVLKVGYFDSLYKTAYCYQVGHLCDLRFLFLFFMRQSKLKKQKRKLTPDSHKYCKDQGSKTVKDAQFLENTIMTYKLILFSTYQNSPNIQRFVCVYGLNFFLKLTPCITIMICTQSLQMGFLILWKQTLAVFTSVFWNGIFPSHDQEIRQLLRLHSVESLSDF